jgi:hypothetical protein
MVVECRAGLDATSSSWMREILSQVRDSTWTGVVIDLTGLEVLDAGGRRMLVNFHKGLIENGRSLEVVSEVEAIRKDLASDAGFAVLQDLSELKRSIHEMAPERMKALLATGMRTSNLYSFRLRCPVCRCEDVKGWLADPHQHSKAWISHEITLQSVTSNPQDTLSVEAYSVAVCPECLFSATRIDWFDAPGSRLPGTLPEGSVERLSKAFARRRALVQDANIEMPLPVFFGMPRVDRAIQLAWALAEESIRAVGRDRSSTDGFGIAVAILMQAKFASESEDLMKYYTASYVWLKQVVEQVGNYAEDRLAEAQVYLMSVALAMGRENEAVQIHRNLVQGWGKDPDAEVWLERARQLVH